MNHVPAGSLPTGLDAVSFHPRHCQVPRPMHARPIQATPPYIDRPTAARGPACRHPCNGQSAEWTVDRPTRKHAACGRHVRPNDRRSCSPHRTLSDRCTIAARDRVRSGLCSNYMRQLRACRAAAGPAAEEVGIVTSETGGFAFLVWSWLRAAREAAGRAAARCGRGGRNTPAHGQGARRKGRSGAGGRRLAQRRPPAPAPTQQIGPGRGRGRAGAGGSSAGRARRLGGRLALGGDAQGAQARRSGWAAA